MDFRLPACSLAGLCSARVLHCLQTRQCVCRCWCCCCRCNAKSRRRRCRRDYGEPCGGSQKRDKWMVFVMKRTWLWNYFILAKRLGNHLCCLLVWIAEIIMLIYTLKSKWYIEWISHLDRVFINGFHLSDFDTPVNVHRLFLYLFLRPASRFPAYSFAAVTAAFLINWKGVLIRVWICCDAEKRSENGTRLLRYWISCVWNDISV